MEGPVPQLHGDRVGLPVVFTLFVEQEGQETKRTTLFSPDLLALLFKILAVEWT